jgi:hypothetical protein
VLLSALVGSPQLRLRVLTGEDALDRPVAGVFTTDLLDPGRYLTGGEIVLTGLMWWRSPEDSPVFVSALADAGVAALGAGDAMLGSVPPDLVEACRQHGLPLFEVPVDVSFAAITEQVMRAFLRPEGPGPAVARLRLLARADHVGDQDPAGGRDPVDAMGTLFTVADAEYGVAGWVLSATGRLVAGTRSAPDAPLRSVLAGACLTEPELPATVTAGSALFALFAVEDQLGQQGQPADRLACWFVVFDGDHTAWDDGRRAIAAELAVLAAGYRARHEDRQRARRRAADGLLGRLLEWRPGRETGEGEVTAQVIAAAARECGLSPRDPLAAVAVTPGQAARVLLEDVLPGSAAGVCGDAVVAVARGGRDVTGRVAGAAAGLGRVPGLDLAFGVSALAAEGGPDGDPDGGQPTNSGGGPAAAWAAGLARAVTEARQAGRLAALLGAGVRVVDGAELGSFELLLAMVPAEARHAYHARLLAPLLAYDRDHGTELVPTLEVFLGCSGSWTRAAETMFVHVNSLRYRIRRIEELTGRSLRSLEDQAALLLALRLAGSAAEDQRAHPPRGGGVQAGQFPAG